MLRSENGQYNFDFGSSKSPDSQELPVLLKSRRLYESHESPELPNASKLPESAESTESAESAESSELLKTESPESPESPSSPASPELPDPSASPESPESPEEGSFKCYERCVYSLVCYTSFFSGMMILTPMFTSQIPRHRCRISSCEGDDSLYFQEFLNFTTPWENDVGEWDSCNVYTSENISSSSCSPNEFNEDISSCNQWIYDTTMYSKTTVSEFNAVCDRTWMLLFDRSSYMIGMFLGGIVIGHASDKYGRRIGLFLSTTILIIGVILTVLSPYYEMFIIMRIITGIGGMGCYESSFIIAMEFVHKKYRTICGILISVPFSFGMSGLVLLSYLIRDWKHLLLVAASPALLIGTYYWLLPESVHWLVSQKRNGDAIKVLEREAYFNKVPISKRLIDESLVSQAREVEGTGKRSIFNALKSKTILKRTLILYYCWFVSGVAYFGLISYGSQVSGNFFVDSLAMIFMDVPAFILSAFFINKIGRRPWNFGMFVLAGLPCICISVLLFKRIENGEVVRYLSMIGKFGASAAYASLYLYSGELYPTECRASAVGSCSMSSRLGGMVYPFVNSLATYSPLIPPLFYGITSILATFLILQLPETLGTELPQTLEESKMIGKSKETEEKTVFATNEAGNHHIQEQYLVINEIK